MFRKILAFAILLVGLSVIIYGLITASLINEAETRQIYGCDRITKEYRPTDIYCHKPKTAPNAKRNYVNTFVYSGLAIMVLGGIYTAMVIKSKK